MGLGLVRGRKFIPSPKVKGHILGIFVLYDMFSCRRKDKGVDGSGKKMRKKT